MNLSDSTVKVFQQYNPVLLKMLELRSFGTLVDLGVSDGDYAIELCRLGFEVTGVDISDGDLKRLEQKAKAVGCTLTAICADMRDFQPAKPMDILLSIASLHFLSSDEILTMLDRMKRFTTPGGLHVISTTTPHQESPKQPGEAERLPWHEIYANWEIIHFEEEAHSSSSKPPESDVWLIHANTRIIAQKPDS